MLCEENVMQILCYFSNILFARLFAFYLCATLCATFSKDNFSAKLKTENSWVEYEWEIQICWFYIFISNDRFYKYTRQFHENVDITVKNSNIEIDDFVFLPFCLCFLKIMPNVSLILYFTLSKYSNGGQ